MTVEIPHDDAAERSVLGILLLQPNTCVELSAADFFNPRHGHVFAAIGAVRTAGLIADELTVADRLRADGLLDEVGGFAVLHELTNTAPSFSLLDQHAHIVARCAMRRRLVHAGDRLAVAANRGDEMAISAVLADLSDTPRLTMVGHDASFDPVDMGPVLTGDLVPLEPTILRRDDATCMWYPGQVNGVHGDSGVGKGWFVLLAICQQITAGRSVMLVDTEDVPTSIASRLRQIGATDDAIRERLIYIRPTDPFDDRNVDQLVAIAVEYRVSLAVLDSLGECFGLDGIDEDRDAEVGPWLRRVARRLADVGAAVSIVDHATKARDNPMHPSGSKRKRAAIGGASYLAEEVVPFSRDKGGRMRIICAKDRHGTYRRGDHVADLVMTIDLTGCRLGLYLPDETAESSENAAVRAAKAAVDALRDEPGPLSQNALVTKMEVKLATAAKRGGIELAVSRGAIAESVGPRKSRLFVFVSDLPELVEADE